MDFKSYLLFFAGTDRLTHFREARCIVTYDQRVGCKYEFVYEYESSLHT